MSEIRLLVFGGRGYSLKHRVWHEIHELLGGVAMTDITIVHGDCPTGADAHARAFCETWKSHGLTELRYPAKWDELDAPGAVVRQRFGKSYNIRAGFVRNQQMLDEGKPTHALGFPGGSGTEDMRKRIERAIAHGAKIELHLITE